MSGVTISRRKTRSSPSGSRTLPWLNMAIALRTTSKITTAATGGPSTTMVANLISMDKIISIINNDFSKKICSQDKIAVWSTFFSEVKFKPAYQQICKERGLYYQNITQGILRELIIKENTNISEKNISRGLQALVMGLWLDQLEDPDTFKRKKAKEVCFDYIKLYFPKQFKSIL